MHTHIIYYATYENKIIYIGSGLPNRYKHVISGTSHIYEINKLHFTEPNKVSVRILKGHTNQEDALIEEKKLILEFKPKYNSQWLEDSNRYSLEESEILKYKSEYIPIKNEIIIRKMLTPFERIEQGSKPSVGHAIEWYEDPTKDNEILFQVFPDFAEWLDSGVTPQNMNTIKVKSKIEDLASSLRIMKKVEEVSLPFKIDNVYSKTKIKDEIQKFYDQHKIKLKAKATDIKKWYTVKDTKNTKGENCFKIISKL